MPHIEVQFEYEINKAEKRTNISCFDDGWLSPQENLSQKKSAKESDVNELLSSLNCH